MPSPVHFFICIVTTPEAARQSHLVAERKQRHGTALRCFFEASLSSLEGFTRKAALRGEVIEGVNVEQPKVTNIRVDLLARLEDHVDVQASNEAEIERRQAEYYLGFYRVLKEHVEQVVLYVGREPLKMRPVF